MTVHFPPSEEELLDCKYECCGRTGAHGFKTENHRKGHYRNVHMNGREYPFNTGRAGRGQRDREKSTGRQSIPAAPATSSLVSMEKMSTPVQTKAVEEKPTMKEENIPPSGSLQPSALSPEVVGRLESQQLPKILEIPPDRWNYGSKVSVPDSDVLMSEASDPPSVRLAEGLSASSDGLVMEDSEAEEWISCSDDDSMLERLEDCIHDDLEAHVECKYQSPTDRILIGVETMIASMSRHPVEDNLTVIKSLVLTALLTSKRTRHVASLKLEWDILAFIEDQFRDHEYPNAVLGSVVTISGSARHAQATTCSDYVQQHWGTRGSEILHALQDALHSPTHTSNLRFGLCSVDGKTSDDSAPSSRAELELKVDHKEVCLNIVSGTPEIIVDTVQQLAWMGTALRTSADSRVQYCEPKLEKISKAKGDEPVVLKVTFEMSSPGEKDHSCWFPLFKNPVIAHRFPTAVRNDHEVGLELPLDMMAALGGARHAMDFEGGLLLKGYSTLFVPKRRHGDSVQWHLICARGEERISYREALAQCPKRALLGDLNHDELRAMRTFLGWWKEAEIHLATADVDYKSIDWSKAKEASPSPRLTGGTLGVSKIISAQVSFVLGAKDGPYHYSQQEPFQKTIDRAEKVPIVLYDQQDRRAWLVSALSVILHIIQMQDHIKPFVVDGIKVQISPLDPSKQGHAAREAVAKNKSQKLFDCEANEEKNYYFRDAILDTWSILDGLMEREATIQATPGIALHTTRQNVLHGWEFRAIAEENRHLKQKAQVLEKTAGRWYNLVKDVDAVVLFASELGDIIRPRSESAGLCREWRRLPKGKDYLAVCVSMLEIFYAKAGHRHDHQYLTSAKLQWHRGPVLFENCANIASNSCTCDRLQQLHHDSYQILGRRKPPGNLEANGCVVFGQAHQSMKLTSRLSNMRDPHARNLDLDPTLHSFASEPNNSIMRSGPDSLTPMQPTMLRPEIATTSWSYASVHQAARQSQPTNVIPPPTQAQQPVTNFPAFSFPSSPISPQRHCVTTSGLASQLETHCNGNDRTRTPSPDRPPPPLRFNNWFRVDELIRQKQKRRRLPHPETASPNGTRYPDEAIQKVFTPSGSEVRAEQENGIPVRDLDGSLTESKQTQSPGRAQDHAPVTVI